MFMFSLSIIKIILSFLRFSVFLKLGKHTHVGILILEKCACMVEINVPNVYTRSVLIYGTHAGKYHWPLVESKCIVIDEWYMMNDENTKDANTALKTVLLK